MIKKSSASLPDFRNWGTVFRLLLISQLARALTSFVYLPDQEHWWFTFGAQSALFEPVLLSVTLSLAIISPYVRQLHYFLGCLAVFLLSAVWTVFWTSFLGIWFDNLSLVSFVKPTMSSCVLVGFLLFYFNWRHYRLSPAWSEARLMALQARIQPHFLFNSLNSVLSLLRVEPRKAETMLEDLCDLYRQLLTDVRQLVPLSQELELARTYLQIEGIRFGVRLQVSWQCQDVPEQALVPPLLLQPLLENAVRYGVEPQAEGAQITVAINGNGGVLDIHVSNPVASGQSDTVHPHGNHMALDNLRERLELHFDAEASLTSECRDGLYQVRVRLPVR